MGIYEQILTQIDQLEKLSTPPAVAASLCRLAREAGPVRARLLPLLELDPALACLVLRVSAGMQPPGIPPLPFLADAAATLEADQLLGIILETTEDEEPLAGLAAAPEPELQLRLKTQPLNVDRPEEGLWGHALGTALAGRILAEHLGDCHPDEAYLAGLLHDVGKSALETVNRAAARTVRTTAMRERLPYCEAERRASMPSHALLGHTLACRWRLPATIRETILRHHEPNPGQRVDGGIPPEVSHLVDVVIMGDAMVRRLRLGTPLDPMGSPAWGAITRKRLGLDRADVSRLSLRLLESWREKVLELLGRSPSGLEGLDELEGAEQASADL